MRAWRLLSIAVATIICLSLALPALAQEPGPRAGMVGITASVQGAQRDIMLPFWASERVVLAPSLSLTGASDIGKDFDVGAVLRYSLSLGRAVPYLGFRFVALTYSPDEGDSATDFVLGPAFGGEYFLDEHFSLQVEAQVNIAISDQTSSRFGNPDGTNYNTATAVGATFYF